MGIKRCPIIGPFANWTCFDDSNTELVHYSEPLSYFFNFFAFFHFLPFFIFCLFPFFASACKISVDKNDLALENIGIDESVLKYVFQNKFIEAHADTKKVCACTFEGMYMYF